MDIGAIVSQIRNYTTVFASVIGAATPEQAENLTNTVMPAAIVIPIGYRAGDDQNMTGVYQSVIESFMVLVALDNSSDRTGLATALASYDTVFNALNSVFLGWRPDPLSERGYYFVDANSLEQDGAKAFYSFQYAQERTLSEVDGWANNQIYLNQPGVIQDLDLVANVVVVIDGNDSNTTSTLAQLVGLTWSV